MSDQTTLAMLRVLEDLLLAKASINDPPANGTITDDMRWRQTGKSDGLREAAGYVSRIVRDLEPR
jgi:hypothetical protein